MTTAQTGGPAPEAPPSGSGNDSEYLVLHVLRIRGLVNAEGVVESSGLDPQAVADELARLAGQGLVRERTGRVSGFSLTKDGRARHASLRDTALSPADAAVISEAYEGFLAPNRALKQATTDWQTDPGGAGADVTERVGVIQGDVAQVLAPVVVVQPRFGAYDRRLAAAVERLRAGQTEALARPMSNSFHDVWMELHEDLLVTLGRERTDEDE